MRKYARRNCTSLPAFRSLLFASPPPFHPSARVNTADIARFGSVPLPSWLLSNEKGESQLGGLRLSLTLAMPR